MAKKIVGIVSRFSNIGDHNKSDTYSHKLESLFQITVNLISGFPESGLETNIPEVRVKVVKTFKIFYRIKADRIEVLRIWDSRQNPERLELK